MKHLSFYLLVFIGAVAFVSCSSLKTTTSLQYSQQPRLGYVTYISQATVFQTLGEHFALVDYQYTIGKSIVLAMKTGEGDTPMYDDRVIGGDFVMIDTYSYTTVPDEYGRSSVKTVPLMLYKEEYLKQIKEQMQK